ncbi:sigma factor-like helix-turn-helix DNA-binding protein [Lederbergia graminis]|uniref:Sigma factor-like helix-turn-helix DNA-binding protein n=1 Tax=Lederbergia graminis TaxID=735518 RepID=A0ABW0LJX9_9BACI
MNEYILIPSYIDNVQDIHSQYLNVFFRDVEIIERKIPLNEIRNVYIKDRELFFKIVDELSLRGFQFISKKTNNILPTINPDFSSYISVIENNNMFLDINFQQYGLSGFAQRFMVENDLFFNHIPLKGFQYFNASLNLIELENEFRLAGFEIQHNEGGNEKSVIPPLKIQHSSNYSTDSVNHSNEENVASVPIEWVFRDNIYRSFKRFCKQKNLEDLNDIREEHLNQFKEMRGIGTYKFNKVIEVLDQYKNADNADKVLSLEELPSRNNSLPDFNSFALYVPVKDVFYERKYVKWMNHCKQNKIKTIGDITWEHIVDFSQLTGVGKKRIDQVIEALEEFDKETKENASSVFSAGYIFPYIKEHELPDIFSMVNIDGVGSGLPAIKMYEIEGKPISEIKANSDLKLYELYQKLQKLMQPREIFSNFKKNKMTARDQLIIQNRFVEEKTLEEMGEAIGVTRERARQIEKKFVSKFKNYLESKQLPLILSLMYPNKKFIFSTVLLELLGEEHSDIIALLKFHPNMMNYLPDIDSFFFNMEEKNEFVEKINDFLEDLPDIFKLSEYQSRIHEFLNFDSQINFETIFESYGLIHYGKFYSRYKLRMTHVLDFIFKYYISGPLKLDEAGINHLRQLALEHFDYQLSDSDRTVDARLRDSKHVLLVEKNTFEWFDPESIEPSLIDSISTYIKDRFNEIEVVNVEEIYLGLQHVMENYHISSKLHLYSLIKYFLEDEFIVGKGNTLNIYRDSSEKLAIEERLVMTIENLGGTTTKDEIEKQLNWQRYKIDLGISKSKQILPWGKNTVKLFSHLLITDEEREELNKLIESCFEKGYTTSSILFENMLFNRKLAPFIQKNGIDHNQKIASLVKSLYPFIKGHLNFLYYEGSKFTNFEEVLVHHFKNEATRSEIQAFIMKHGYKELMVSILITSIVEKDLFTEIDLGLYYPTSKFQISEDAIEALTQYIETQMKDKAYLSLNLLEGYRTVLPSVDFRWNPFSMKSVLIKNGYRQIQKIYQDYRYDMIIIVSEKSKIKSFEELVHFILFHEYQGNLHESDVYDFLANKGILRKRDSIYEKVLPYEIKNDGTLIKVDEIGMVKLK